MAEPEIKIGNNTVVEEDANGDTSIRNTNTGNEIQLDTVIELIGSDVSIEDDEKLFFGTDNDWSISFDAANTEVTIRDENGASDIAVIDAAGLDVTGETTTDSLGGALTGGTTISNLLGNGLKVATGTLQAALGDGLDIVSGNIQILDSIWDSVNSEIVADVNNTSTTTQALEAESALTELLDLGSQNRLDSKGTSVPDGSLTTIKELIGNFGAEIGGLALVRNFGASGSFLDVVSFSDGRTEIISSLEDSGASGRSYSLQNDPPALQLAVTGSSEDVVCTTLTLNPSA